MSKLNRTLSVVAGLLIVAAVSFFLLNSAGATEEAAAPASTVALKELPLGKPDAPVKIYEYASLSCSHCAHFATTVLPEVKKQLLDTGKAVLIYRDFPLDQFAVKAAQVAHCVPDAQYYNMLEVLFSNQARWTGAKEPLDALQQLASLAGLDAAAFKACTENKALETAILERMKAGQDKFGINSTPTFIFNDGAEKLVGAQDVTQFNAIVDKLSKGK